MHLIRVNFFFEFFKSFCIFFIIDSCQYEVLKYKLNCTKGVYAQYLYGEYRFIPTKAENTFIMDGDTLNVDVDKYPSGIIKSKNYPVWEELSNYAMKLVSQDPNKAIKFYVTDMFIEEFSDKCDTAFLEFSDT